eukprot:5466087-Alexandrium_andersonii.AAC.1
MVGVGADTPRGRGTPLLWRDPQNPNRGLGPRISMVGVGVRLERVRAERRRLQRGVGAGPGSGAAAPQPCVVHLQRWLERVRAGRV